MNDRLSELLDEVADSVKPGDRLDAIRGATARARRTRRARWTAGGLGLVAASTAVVLALTPGGTPRRDPDPATGSPTTPAYPRIDREPPAAIYYVGDTPAGPRLFRELRRVVTERMPDPLTAAVAAAVGDGGDGRAVAPKDPDYRVPWPPLTTATSRVVPFADLIEIDLRGETDDSLRDRGTVSAEEARLALEQLIRTAQGVVAEALPVRFLLNGKLADRVLGVPTSEPLTVGSDLAVLAHVSLSDPSEGQRVDNDEPFTVTGVGNSFEGTIVTRIQRWEGTYIVDEKPAIAGWEQDRLYPWEVTFDLTDVPPGDYVVISRTDDPSGEGTFDTDTRRITVVD
jgi:hypothetical protein